MNSARRYTTIAIILHWVIAIMIIGQIAGGWFMHRLPNSSPVKFDMYQVHKSFGITILLLTVLRLGWRLANKPPALPVATPGWEKLAARSTHWLFYALLIATPLAGWAMVSVSPTDIATVYFGVLEWPHLPFFDGGDRAGVEDMLKDSHEFLAFSILGLLVLHVGAALKHHFINRDEVLSGMAPGNLAQGLGVTVLLATVFTAGAFYWFAPKTPVSNATPSVAPSAVSSAAAPAIETVVADPATGAVVADNVAPAVEQAPAASVWMVDKSTSSLGFIGKERDNTFEGVFGTFDAAITFNPDDLDAAAISVTVSTASASTGDSLRDSNLPGGQWFDVKDHPSAIFTSTMVVQTGKGAYEAHGTLSIKEFEQDIVLPFTLEIDGDKARAKGEIVLIRTDYGLGAGAAWLDEEGVGLDVAVRFEINARRR